MDGREQMGISFFPKFRPAATTSSRGTNPPVSCRGEFGYRKPGRLTSNLPFRYWATRKIDAARSSPDNAHLRFFFRPRLPYIDGELLRDQSGHQEQNQGGAGRVLSSHGENSGSGQRGFAPPRQSVAPDSE